MDVKYVILLGAVLFSCMASAQFSDLNSQEQSLEEQFGNEDVVSIATGTKQTLQKAPAVATVITAKMISQIGAIDLDEVLETVPGLHVGKNSNSYNPIYIFRGMHAGFNPQVLVLINGISISQLHVGNRGQAWGGMPVEAISRIEVIRGPGSALYGADAFAGVINIITKTPQELNGTSLTLRAARYNSKGFALLHGSALGEWDVGLVVEYYKTDGYDGVIDIDAQTFLDDMFMTRASRAPAEVSLSRDNVDIRFEAGIGNIKFRTGFQRRDDHGSGAGVAEALDPTSRFQSDRFNADLSWTKNFNNNWSLEAQISHLNTTLEPLNNLILFPAGVDFGGGVYPNGLIGNPELYERHTRVNIASTYGGFKRHDIRVGAGYYLGDLYRSREVKNFGINPLTLEPLPTDSPLVDVSDTPFVFLQEGYRENRFLYIQDIWTLSADWELTLGLRHDDYSDFGSTTNPRAALVWSVSHNMTIKLLYAEAFRAPSFSETRAIANPVLLGNPNLKPEKLNSYEAAFDYRPSDAVSLVFNLYRYKWKDIIEYQPDDELLTRTAVNSDTQVGQGFELDINWQVSKKLSLFTNYAFNDATRPIATTMPNTSQHADVAFSPKRQLQLGGYYQFNDSFYLNLQTNRVMDRAREFGDTREPIQDFTQLNLTLGYKSTDGVWRIRSSIYNVLDEDVRSPSVWTDEFANIPHDLPQRGRNWRVDITYWY